MKITGLDGLEYPSVEECMKADEVFTKTQKAREEAEAARKAATSKKKKEMADAITAADAEVDAANIAYEKAKEEAQNILEEAREKVREIVGEAAQKCRKAVDARYKAVKAFNEEFGTYTISYTGAKALEEYDRALRQWNRFFDRFRLFW